MTFPNFHHKHSEDSILTPQDYIEYQKKKNKYLQFGLLKGVIFCYQKSVIHFIHRQINPEKIINFDEAGILYLIKTSNGEIGVCHGFGIGGPAVTTILEELIALGVKDFISIGTAGTLQKEIRTGDIVICEKAIRDEGTSHHYLKESKYSFSSKLMNQRMKSAFKNRKQKYLTGTNWTTDAPYRETRSEVIKYQNEGVKTVDMEAASLFAVGEYRNVNVGCIFTIGDSLAELKWHPEFNKETMQDSLKILLKIAFDVLQNK